MFLGVTAEVTNWHEDGKQCSLIMNANENPFADFVELPPAYKELVYCNILCGVIRGALEMVCLFSPVEKLASGGCMIQVQLRVECEFVHDVLKGDEFYEIRIRLKEIMQDTFADDE